MKNAAKTVALPKTLPEWFQIMRGDSSLTAKDVMLLFSITKADVRRCIEDGRLPVPEAPIVSSYVFNATIVANRRYVKWQWRKSLLVSHFRQSGPLT